MRLSNLFSFLTASFTIASALGDQASITTLGNVGKPLPISGDEQSPGLHDAKGEPLRPIKKGTAVAKGLCLYSVEELRMGPVVFFSPYSLDQLIAAKERLERAGDCEVFHTPSITALETRSGGTLEADRNAPRCVNAILPSPSPGDAEVSPDNSDKSTATHLGVPALLSAVAFTAFIAF